MSSGDICSKRFRGASRFLLLRPEGDVRTQAQPCFGVERVRVWAITRKSVFEEDCPPSSDCGLRMRAHVQFCIGIITVMQVLEQIFHALTHASILERISPHYEPRPPVTREDQTLLSHANCHRKSKGHRGTIRFPLGRRFAYLGCRLCRSLRPRLSVSRLLAMYPER